MDGFKEANVQKPVIGIVDEVTVRAIIKAMPQEVWNDVVRYYKSGNGHFALQRIVDWIDNNFTFANGAKIEQFNNYTNIFLKAVGSYIQSLENIKNAYEELSERPAGMFLKKYLTMKAGEELGEFYNELGQKLVNELYQAIKQENIQIAQKEAQQFRYRSVEIDKMSVQHGKNYEYKISIKQGSDGPTKKFHFAIPVNEYNNYRKEQAKLAKSIQKAAERVGCELPIEEALKAAKDLVEKTASEREKLMKKMLR
jgi:hypothetical protein